MPRFARVVVPDWPHHVTHRGNNRHDVFWTDDDRRVYLSMLAEHAKRYDAEIVAYCLMTNHVHLIVTPRRGRSLELTIGRTHHRFSLYTNRTRGHCGHLWHDRFFSCPMDEPHFARAVRYVEQNPVRAGIVEQPWLYPWSSAAAHCAESEPHRVLGSALLADWTADEWRSCLRMPVEQDEARTIRRQTSTGRPLATDRVIAQLETRLERRLRPNPVGRPPKSTSARRANANYQSRN